MPALPGGERKEPEPEATAVLGTGRRFRLEPDTGADPEQDPEPKAGAAPDEPTGSLALPVAGVKVARGRNSEPGEGPGANAVAKFKEVPPLPASGVVPSRDPDPDPGPDLVELGPAVEPLASVCPDDIKLHMTPWRRHALQDGLVSSH